MYSHSRKVVDSYLGLDINRNDTCCGGFSQSIHVFLYYLS